jgi:hypothetical protein
MSDGCLTLKEIDKLLSAMDKGYKKERKLHKKELERNASTAYGVVRAIRDSDLGEYRTHFTLTDEEAENLIIQYAKICK